jgi:hypothetical protein
LSEKYEEKLREKEAEKGVKAELFSPSDILADANTVRRVYIPEIDRTVEYCPLSLKDLEEVKKAKSDQERATRTLWKMLNKANSEWTLERVESLPVNVAAAIIRHVTPPLTQTPQPSESGPAQTQQPSYTA